MGSMVINFHYEWGTKAPFFDEVQRSRLFDARWEDLKCHVTFCIETNQINVNIRGGIKSVQCIMKWDWTIL
jgi:hypothetical protein